METAAAIKASRASRSSCAHCGLPVTSPSRAELYCCHACRLVAIIVGSQEQGVQRWNLLRLGFGALLAMNIMMISLLLYTGSVDAEIIHLFRLILLALAVPALAILIPPFLMGAIREIGAGRPSLDALIAGGSLSAFAVSAVNALGGEGEIYFDTATMIPVLVTLGKIIEASAKSRAADLLHTLEALLPARALRVTPAGTEEVEIGHLRPGDQVRVRPGERVPVDGAIVEGMSSIEEAAFSGEFSPRFCRPGDRVIAGTVNGTGALLVQAERTGNELLLHGIIEMIQDAWSNPSRVELMARRAATLFIPAVVLIAAGSLAGWWLLGDTGRGLLSALSVLVVACPCTMGIATPLATSLATARAARAGVVVRDASVMELLAAVQTVFLDKTGTLTVGSPVVKEIQLIDPLLDRDEFLGRLAALESASEHPLGKALLSMANSCGIEAGSCSQLRVFPGSGISGVVTWRGIAREVTAGTGSFVSGSAEPAAMDGSSTVVNVAWEGKVRGAPLRAGAWGKRYRLCAPLRRQACRSGGNRRRSRHRGGFSSQ